MRGSFTAVCVVLMIGCTGSAGHGAAKSSPTTVAPTNTPDSSTIQRPPSPPAPSPADLPLSTVQLTCRLPVLRSATNGDFLSMAGGFVTFPGATFQPDPAGKIASRSGQGDFVTVQTPVLYGVPYAGPPFYDAAQLRWVPATAAQTSADGSAYAYATPGASTSDPAHIHVVNVARGTERIFNVTAPKVVAPNAVLVTDFDGAGVYFVISRVDQYPSGVWRLDVGSGAVKALAQVTNVMKVRAGYAWVGRVDPHDSSPLSDSAGRPLNDSIVSIDLSSGAETRWYYSPSHGVALRGLDSYGHPVVSTSFEPSQAIDTSEIRLIDTPLSGGENNGALIYGGGPWLSDPQADGDRLWFGSDRGIYLYTPATGLQKVFAFNGNRDLGETVLPVGVCR